MLAQRNVNIGHRYVHPGRRRSVCGIYRISLVVVVRMYFTPLIVPVMALMLPLGMVVVLLPSVMMPVVFPVTMATVRPRGRREYQRGSDKHAFE